ncbi:MAG: P1 family peptidase [Desulfomonilia bacterium]
MGAQGNTTLCVLVTDARLDKVTAMQIARMGGNGLARHISPYNTPFDGDMVFCFSIGDKEIHPLHLGVLAAQAAKDALLNAVRHARSLGGLPASSDILARTFPADASVILSGNHETSWMLDSQEVKTVDKPERVE